MAIVVIDAGSAIKENLAMTKDNSYDYLLSVSRSI
jgi:hypothetical protein